MFDFKGKWRGGYKVVEELGELTQVLCKMFMVRGLKHWDGNLIIPLLDEIADVLASIVYFCSNNLTPAHRVYIANRIAKKLALYKQWEKE